jgi:serine/threonine protein phosphatase PrpC
MRLAKHPQLAVESIAGKRPYQEDSVLAETLPDGRTLLAVADGMGGHAAGEVASALALKTLFEAVGERRDLGSAFRMANERVHRMASEPGKQGMGTTLVAVLVDGAEYWVANVGDSRAYQLSPGGIRRLTEDHSFVAEAMKRGQSEAEAMATPWKDALTRSIGTEGEVEVDVFGPHPLDDDTAFLICSDGLYKTLGDQELRSLFGRSGGARGAAQALVAAAYDAGSDDNISVAIAEYGGVPREDSATTQILAYDPVVGAAGVGAENEPDSATGSSSAPTSAPRARTPAAPVDEATVVGGLPLAALAAILVVGVLVAILIFGG